MRHLSQVLTRRAILLSVLLLIIFSFPACSKKQPESKEIKIGAILPLSGESAAYGNWIKEAIDLVKEETNTAGGINGKRLEVIYEDDKGQPSVATSAMQKLVSLDKVPIVYGSWVSSCVLAQAPIAEKTRTVVMAEAISPKIREAGDYIFRFDPDARLALAKLIPFVADQNHLRIAILYINNDFGLDQANVFQTGIEGKKGNVVFKEGYEPGTNDFRTTLTKIKDVQANAVFMPGYLEMATILQQARELGIKTQFYSSFPFENINILKVAGESAEGVIYPYFFDAHSTNPIMLDYQKRYKEKYGRPSEGFAALAYGGMTIIVNVLQKVGPVSEKIKDELYKIKDYPSPFGLVSFDDKGDIDIPILIKTVRKGEFVVLQQ